jgi:Mrp family chromosome partitioning ATPase
MSGLIMTREILSAPAVMPVRVNQPAVFASDPATSRMAAIANEPPRRNEPSVSSESAIANVAYNLRRSGSAGDRLAVFGAAAGINTSQAAIKLARALADDSRVVLVGLASDEATIRGISSEPSADGLAELARGAASFGAIITKDKLSPLHLISAGHSPIGRLDILSSPGMATNFGALARSYDHVVVDAGEASGPGIERIAEIAPHAVLVTDTLANAATGAARQRLLTAGFSDVRILVGAYGHFGETAAAA